MTGTGIVSRALVELARPATLLMEDGRTILQVGTEALNFAIDNVATRRPFQWLIPDDDTLISTVPDQFVYDYPEGVLEIFNIALDTGSTDSRPLDKLPLRRFRRKWAAIEYLAQGKPYQWAQRNDKRFSIAPRPDSVYIMRTVAAVRPTPITNFSLEVQSVPARHHEMLVYGIAARLASLLQWPEKAGAMLAMHENLLGLAIAEDKRDPDVEYAAQPYRAQGVPYNVNYWQTPHVTGLE